MRSTNIVKFIEQLQALADKNPNLCVVTQNDCADNGISMSSASIRVGKLVEVKNWDFPYVDDCDVSEADSVLII